MYRKYQIIIISLSTKKAVDNLLLFYLQKLFSPDNLGIKIIFHKFIVSDLLSNINDMKKAIFFFFLSLLLSSCSTIRFIDIDIQKPAQVTLGAGIRNIAIVNNAVKQPDDVGHWMKTPKETEAITISTDSSNIILVQALAQFMEEDGFFSTVTLHEEPLREDNEFLVEKRLPSSVMNKIKRETNAELIISLDKIILTSTYSVNIVNKKSVPWGLSAGIYAKLRAYTIDSNEEPREMILSDSVQWRGSWEGNYYSEDIPSYEEAFKFIIVRAADKIAKALSPAWKSEERWYYSNAKTEMKLAATKASSGEWKEAAIIWGEALEKENNENQKGKLASNIALANEMLDDIENAISWIDIALVHFNNAGKKDDSENVKLAKNYKKRLEKRLQDFEKLDVQLGANVIH